MRFLRFMVLPFVLALFDFTAQATLTTPSIVSPSNGATNQTPDVMIDWSTVTGTTVYQYKISTNPGLTGATIVSTGTNSYMYLSNLRFGTTYYWQCRAVKNTAPLDSSAWSTIWNFTTTDQITQVSPSNGATNQTPDLQLDWSSLSGITYYDYEFDTVSTFNSPLHIYGSATSSYSYFYTSNLRFGTKYYWRARARHSVDTTQWTSIWYFTTTNQITQVSPSNGATNQTPDVQLDWSSLSGITYYDYEFDTVSSFNSPLHVYGSATSSYSYFYTSNLRFGTKYYWRARARHSVDTTQWTSVWYFTTTDQITQVSPSNGATNQTPDVQLDWSSLSGITYYDYEFDTVSTFNSPLHVYGSATSSYSYFYTSNLRFGTKYYWRARARHSVDTTQWTSVWYFTTTDQITQVSPSNGATNQTPDVQLDWSSLSGITYYDYEFDTVSSFNSPLHVYGSATSSYSYYYTSNLRFGTKYYWRARARHSVDTTQWTSIWYFITTNQITQVSPSNGATNQTPDVMLDWSSLSGITYYDYEFDTVSSFNSPLHVYGSATSSYSYFYTSNLRFGTKYYWRARARHSVDTTQWTSVWYFTTTDQLTLVSPSNGATGIAIAPMLDWSSLSGITGYQYRYSTNSNMSAAIYGTTTSSYSYVYLSGLAYGTTYYWQARAFHTQDSTQWTASWSFTTTFQMPTAPTLISPSNGSTNIALTGTAFQWNSVSGATSYEYAYADNSSFNNAITTSTSLLTGNSGALQGSTTYYWKVRASNGFGYSPWSTVWSFTTVIQYNVAPTLISPPNNTINIAISGTTLQWSSINGATVYEYQLALDSLFAGPQTGTTSLQSASTGSLQTAATYYWKVKAGNGSTWSPWSVVWHFSTINPMPTAPTLISPPDNSTNIPIAGTGLQWSSVAGATSYNYQYSTDSLFATAVSSNTSALTTTTAALSATTNYFWRVRASDGTNYSPWSVVWSFTTLTPSLAAPVLISPADNATGIPTSGASYQWSSVSGATFYEYQYDVDSLFTAPVVSTTSNTSATSAALQAGTVYFWRVRAGDGSIYSPWSTVWSFTTANLVLAAPLLTSPSDNSTNIPVTGTTLQWQGVSGATFYESMYDIDSLFTNPVSGNTGNLSISTLTLLSNTEYFWKVRAGNGLIYSPWSEIWSFITEPATGIQLTPANKELVVYPNPSQGNFSVQIPDASGGTVQIIITDLLGNIVFGNDNINDNNITLKLQNISNGTYILAYTRGTKKITKPIIIAR